MRLAKHLAHAGIASRRASERLIAEGRVTVAGETVRDPARDVAGSEEIAVDGRRVGSFERRVLYVVNKPVGVLSTASDPFGRPTVVELIEQETRRLYPIGRLDLDSEGLILLSNDGELAHALTHPSFGVAKAYVVEVTGGRVGAEALRRLRTGVRLEDGMTGPADVKVLSDRSGAAQLKITIHEGRNRQVRRMCEAVGHEVRRLKRVSFGPLQLGDLREGQYRRLGEDEVQALRTAARADSVPGPASGGS